MTDKATDLLEQIKKFLDQLGDEERKEIQEIQFTAIRREPAPDETSICFYLVASVPFGPGKAERKV